MTTERPAPVGLYEMLQDFECPSASVRVFVMHGPGDAVGGHVHRRSVQIYVALEGTVVVDVDGTEHRLAPYAALPVWPGSVHRASPLAGPAIVMNISIPPLGPDDQLPVGEAAEPPDMRLPLSDVDVDD